MLGSGLRKMGTDRALVFTWCRVLITGRGSPPLPAAYVCGTKEQPLHFIKLYDAETSTWMFSRSLGYVTRRTSLAVRIWGLSWSS